MNWSIILGHPRVGSFNHAVADMAVDYLKSRGVNVHYHDLYAEAFPPVLPHEESMRDAVLPELIARHCEEIQCADGIIIIHPNWWGQPPAILKGWVDRVLRPGVAYRFIENDGGEGVPEGLLRARIAVIFNTSNTNPAREQTVFGDPLETLWKNCIFGLCGVNSFVRKTFAVMVGSSDAQRQVWLGEAEDEISKAFSSVSV